MLLRLIYLTLLFTVVSQVMFLQNKGDVTMTIELLDTEEAQGDDPLDVQVQPKCSNGISACKY